MLQIHGPNIADTDGERETSSLHSIVNSPLRLSNIGGLEGLMTAKCSQGTGADKVKWSDACKQETRLMMKEAEMCEEAKSPEDLPNDGRWKSHVRTDPETHSCIATNDS